MKKLVDNIDTEFIDGFSHQVERMYGRLKDLYNNGNDQAAVSSILPQALIEIGNISEIVDLAVEELYQQNEELIETRNLLEAQRQSSEDLFELAPECYLVTDPTGTIVKVNRIAGLLFGLPQQFMVNKPIVNFVAAQEHQRFLYLLSRISTQNKSTRLIIRFKQSNGVVFDAFASVGIDSDRQQGKPIYLRWIIRDITKRLQNECDICFSRTVHQYCKGETISLESPVIWYVIEGVVKLSTVNQSGEEMLVGLAGKEMVFGSSMTSQKTPKATALCNIKLISIHQAEIATNPALSLIILPKINQRLQQTESFLVNFGRRRVKERLYYLLQLLKQVVGQPITEGTRLDIRLTHEELACACGTTRVTVTKLLNKLKEENKISFDFKHHIVISYTH